MGPETKIFCGSLVFNKIKYKIIISNQEYIIEYDDVFGYMFRPLEITCLRSTFCSRSFFFLVQFSMNTEESTIFVWF